MSAGGSDGPSAHARPVRYGIVGAGMMGLEHIRNLQLIPGARIVAVADPHEASLRWARLTLKEDADLIADPRELVAREDVDALVIATPNHTHAEVLLDVLASGKHVLVEKPLCTTVEDCLRVERAASASDGVCWVGMQYRFMPPIAHLIDAVRSGAVGRLVMLAIREHRFPFLAKVGNWNRFARNSGGTLIEKCCHFFDLMRLIVGAEATAVYASGSQDVNHLDERYDGEIPDIIDNAYVVVDFENGARALLDLCMFAEGSRNQEEIAVTGDAGKVECFLPDSTVVLGRRDPPRVESRHVPVEKRILEAGFHHGSTYFEHRAFLEAVRSGTPPAVTVRDGVLAVVLGAAAERSLRERRRVPVAELLP